MSATSASFRLPRIGLPSLLLTPARASDLAALRIAAFFVLLLSPDARLAVHAAAQPHSLAQAPVGGGFLLPLLHLNPQVWGFLQVALLVSAALALVGLWTRASAIVAALLALVVLGLPNLFGTVRHVHHLVWLPALLAASPCGDAWSVDAWLARRHGQPSPMPSARYGFPLQVAWLLAGCIYFFPGLHKLLGAGLAWAWSDNLLHHMHWKWLQVGQLPALRIDQWPGLVRFGALGVLLLELSWLPLALWRPGRLLLLGVTMLFHQATAHLMFIHFSSLWVLWLGLLPHAARSLPLIQPDELRSKAGNTGVQRLSGSRLSIGRVSMVMAGILLTGAMTMGALGITAGWPFACFPHFARPVGAEMPALRVAVTHAGGSVTQVQPWRWIDGDRQRRWGQQWRLAFAQPADTKGLLAWWCGERHRLSKPGETVRFYRAWLSTVPSDEGREVRADALTPPLPLSACQVRRPVPDH